VAGWSGLQVITVGGSADGEVEAQLYEATREGGFGILAGSRKETGDFWLGPPKNVINNNREIRGLKSHLPKFIGLFFVQINH